jgi:hypothetical protein
MDMLIDISSRGAMPGGELSGGDGVSGGTGISLLGFCFFKEKRLRRRRSDAADREAARLRRKKK